MAWLQGEVEGCGRVMWQGVSRVRPEKVGKKGSICQEVIECGAVCVSFSLSLLLSLVFSLFLVISKLLVKK